MSFGGGGAGGQKDIVTRPSLVYSGVSPRAAFLLHSILVSLPAPLNGRGLRQALRHFLSLIALQSLKELTKLFEMLEMIGVHNLRNPIGHSQLDTWSAIANHLMCT